MGCQPERDSSPKTFFLLMEAYLTKISMLNVLEGSNISRVLSEFSHRCEEALTKYGAEKLQSKPAYHRLWNIRPQEMDTFVSYCQTAGHPRLVDVFSRQNITLRGGRPRYKSESSQYRLESYRYGSGRSRLGSDSSRYNTERVRHASDSSRYDSNSSRRGLETFRSSRGWHQDGNSRTFQRTHDVSADWRKKAPQATHRSLSESYVDEIRDCKDQCERAQRVVIHDEERGSNSAAVSSPTSPDYRFHCVEDGVLYQVSQVLKD